MADVDLVVTCFERTWRQVLEPGFFTRIEQQNRREFAERTVLVNNVDDRAAVEAAVAGSDATRAVFVEDVLDTALARTGFTRAELPTPRYFLDWGLCAVTLDGPEFVLHWDADAVLVEPFDWVGPSLELMAADPRVLVAGPDSELRNLDAFRSEDAGDFVLGHGFSDQLFLGRRADLGRPIYTQRCLAKWRYPYPSSFEARIDAYLRHAGRLRATHRDAVYLQPVAMGTSWPDRSLGERAAAKGRGLVIDIMRAVPDPVLPPHLRQL